MSSALDFAYYAGLLWASIPLSLKLAGKRGRRHVAGLSQRLGACAPRRSGRPCVWIHGVSVGEVRTAAPLIRALQARYPNHELVVSTTTGTGQEVARQAHPDLRVIYFPLDLTWAVDGVLRAIRPDLVVLVELEIWPNFLEATRRRKIPVAIVNGRITERSYRGYARIRRWLFDPLAAIQTYCVQTPAYAERFRRLGVPEHQLHITGSMKYDLLPMTEGDGSAARAEFGLREDDLVLLGGSTHPSEEDALIESYLELRGAHPTLRLVVCPRHTERAAEVRRLLEERGVPVVARTEQRPLQAGEALLVDTVGELGRLYGAADVVFVGGSLIPHGGQNMLEPANLGKPVVFGPHTMNFAEPVERLLAAEGACRVDGADDLRRALRALCGDLEAARAMGERGRGALLAARGATERTVEALSSLASLRED